LASAADGLWSLIPTVNDGNGNSIQGRHDDANRCNDSWKPLSLREGIEMQGKQETEGVAQTSPSPKLSGMIWEFAGDFIRLGSTPEQRHVRLTAASSAWNIAASPSDQRQKILDRFMTEYQRCNPSANPSVSAAIRSDMEALIARKLKLFPTDLRQIINARLIQIDGKDRIEVASATVR
jgi:hypothetical protein